MRVELGIFGDLHVLIADHVCLTDYLTASDAAVWLVESERAHGALKEVGVAHVTPPTDTLAPGTDVERAREVARPFPVKREKPVSLNA